MMGLSKKGGGTISLFLALMFIIMFGIWVMGAFNPILEFNFGAAVAPIVFSLVCQLIANYDFRSPFFSLLVGIITLMAFVSIFVGFNYQILIIGLLSNLTLYFGEWMDDTRNLPGVTGVYSILLFFFSLIVAVVLVSVIVI